MKREKTKVTSCDRTSSRILGLLPILVRGYLIKDVNWIET